MDLVNLPTVYRLKTHQNQTLKKKILKIVEWLEMFFDHILN
jgi:hypothetical protein